ncbi:MAG: hypothetical protein JF588_22085 [Caulobacterales bacterium]|nr:hypothetical protein [Caulobacterales bacterium]
MPTSADLKDEQTRWLVEILGWDASLGLSIVRPGLPEEAKVHGELAYSRGIDIRGRLVAPKSHSDKAIRVWLSPSPLRYWAGPEALDEVGQFNPYDTPKNGSDFDATILIPEDSLTYAVVSLGSAWRYIHIWTLDPFPRASIARVSFSQDVHPNLEPWIRGEASGLF